MGFVAAEAKPYRLHFPARCEGRGCRIWSGALRTR